MNKLYRVPASLLILAALINPIPLSAQDRFAERAHDCKVNNAKLVAVTQADPQNLSDTVEFRKNERCVKRNSETNQTGPGTASAKKKKSKKKKKKNKKKKKSKKKKKKKNTGGTEKPVPDSGTSEVIPRDFRGNKFAPANVCTMEFTRGVNCSVHCTLHAGTVTTASYANYTYTLTGRPTKSDTTVTRSDTVTFPEPSGKKPEPFITEYDFACCPTGEDGCSVLEPFLRGLVNGSLGGKAGLDITFVKRDTAEEVEFFVDFADGGVR